MSGNDDYTQAFVEKPQDTSETDVSEEQTSSSKYDGKNQALTQEKKILIVVVSIVLAAILAILDPDAGIGLFILYILGFMVLVYFIGTKEGRKDTMAIMNGTSEQRDEQQQQTVGGEADESKRVCSNCGWQNPASNNYCHDCGEKLE